MSLKKSKEIRKYLPWLIAIGMIFFSIGFVLSQVSQGVGLPSSGAVPNPGHPAEQILCNGCVDTGNIKNGAILNADISNSAAIDPLKIGGVNGWYLTLPALSAANVWADFSPAFGTIITTWVNSQVYFTCDSSVDGDIRPLAGSQSANPLVFRWNQKFAYLSSPSTIPPPQPTEIYRYQDSTGIYVLEMQINPNDLTKLQFRKRIVSGTPAESPPNNWECLYSIVTAS